MRRRRNPIIDRDSQTVKPVAKVRDEKTGRQVIDFNFSQVRDLKYRTKGNVVVPINKILSTIATVVSRQYDQMEKQREVLGDAWSPDIDVYGRFFNAMQDDFANVGTDTFRTNLRRANNADEVLALLNQYFTGIFKRRLADGEATSKQKLVQQKALEDEFADQLEKKDTAGKVALGEKLSELAKAYKQLQVWYNGVAPTDEEMRQLAEDVERHNKDFEAYIAQVGVDTEEAKQVFINQYVKERMEKFLRRRLTPRPEIVTEKIEEKIREKAKKAYAENEIDPFLYRRFPKPDSLRMTLLRMLMGEPIAVYRRMRGKLDYTVAEYKTYLGKNRNRFGVVQYGETPSAAKDLWTRYSSTAQAPTSNGYVQYIIRNWVPALKEFQPTPEYVQIVSSKFLSGAPIEEGDFDPFLAVSAELGETIDDELGESSAIEDFQRLQSRVKEVLAPLFQQILFHANKLKFSDTLNCFVVEPFAKALSEVKRSANIDDVVAAYIKDNTVSMEDKASISRNEDGTYNNADVVWSWLVLQKYPNMSSIIDKQSSFAKMFLAPKIFKQIQESDKKQQYIEDDFTLDKEPYLSAMKVSKKDIRDAQRDLQNAYMNFRKSKAYAEIEQKLQLQQNEYNEYKNEVLDFLKASYFRSLLSDKNISSEDKWLRSPFNLRDLDGLRKIIRVIEKDALAKQDVALTETIVRLQKLLTLMESNLRVTAKLMGDRSKLAITPSIDYKRTYLRRLRTLQDKLEFREQQQRLSFDPNIEPFYPKVGDSVSISLSSDPTHNIPAQILEVDYISRTAKLLPSKQYYKPSVGSYKERVLFAPLRSLRKFTPPNEEYLKNYVPADATDPFVYLQVVKGSTIPVAVGQYRELKLTEKYTSNTEQLNMDIGVEIIVLGPIGSRDSQFYIGKNKALVAVPQNTSFNYDQLYVVPTKDLGLPILTEEQALKMPKLYFAPPGVREIISFPYVEDLEVSAVRHNPHR